MACQTESFRGRWGKCHTPILRGDRDSAAFGGIRLHRHGIQVAPSTCNLDERMTMLDTITPRPSTVDRRDDTARYALVQRVYGEFHEMPCMRLTAPQARLLFGLRPDVCERVLAAWFSRVRCAATASGIASTTPAGGRCTMRAESTTSFVPGRPDELSPRDPAREGWPSWSRTVTPARCRPECAAKSCAALADTR